MRSFLVVMTVMMFWTAGIKNAEKAAPQTPMPTHSQELKKLSEEKDSLRSHANTLEAKQDFWHNLAIGAAVIAGVVGLLALGAQFRESRLAYLARAKVASISIIEGDIEALEKEDSDKAISLVGQKAELARVEQIRLSNENLVLQKSVEAEKIKRLQLESRILPRSLTQEQQRVVSNRMIGLGPQLLDVVLYPNDGETQGIAKDISHCLRDWTFNTFFPSGGQAIIGIALEYNPRDVDAKVRATALQEELVKQGLKVSKPSPTLPAELHGEVGSTVPPNTLPSSLRLTVGTNR